MVNYATFLSLSVIHIRNSVGKFRSTWASRRSALKIISDIFIELDVKLTSNGLTNNVSDALWVLKLILINFFALVFRLSHQITHLTFMVNHWIKVLH